MRCIKCHKETPATEMYCRHCGIKINVSFDEITRQMGKEVDKEQKAETEAFFRWILFLILFVWLCGVLFNQLWQNPLEPRITPAYIPVLEMPTQTYDIAHPLIIPQPMKDDKQSTQPMKDDKQSTQPMKDDKQSPNKN